MGLKGKRGPKPERIEEVQERENDPTAEEIVGEENVVDVTNEHGLEMQIPADNIGFQQPQGYNKRELRRLDTGEVIETAALTMEDKLIEEQKAAEANAEPETMPEQEEVTQ